MLVCFKGDHQLGADAVGAADEHRFLEPVARKVEHAAERADGIDRAHRLRARNMTFDQSYGFITGFQIDAGFSVFITHVIFSCLSFLTEIVDAVGEDVLLLISVNVLEQSFLIAFAVTHLAQDPSVRRGDALDGITKNR